MHNENRKKNSVTMLFIIAILFSAGIFEISQLPNRNLRNEISELEDYIHRIEIERSELGLLLSVDIGVQEGFFISRSMYLRFH